MYLLSKCSFCQNSPFTFRPTRPYRLSINVPFTKMYLLSKCTFCQNVPFVKMYLLSKCSFCQNSPFTFRPTRPYRLSINVPFTKMYCLPKCTVLSKMYLLSFLHSFIHCRHLYSASSSGATH